MPMFALFVLLGLLLLAAVLFGLALWLQPETHDMDDDEDTVWVDVREWNILHRLFGARPLRLPPADRKDKAGA